MSRKQTKKELIKEIIKCAKDPIYFLETYGKIVHPQEGILDFKLYDYQKDIINNYVKNRRNVILKARQLGITTITGGFIAWLMIFHRHSNVVIMATKLEKAKIPLRVIKNIIKYLPKWLIPGMVSISVNNRTRSRTF